MVQPTVHANEGALATLRVYVSGDPRPDVRWQRGRRDVDTTGSSRFRLLDGATLQIVGVEPGDQGVYTCVADNGRGRPATADVSLAVDSPTRCATTFKTFQTFPNHVPIVRSHLPCVTGRPYILGTTYSIVRVDLPPSFLTLRREMRSVCVCDPDAISFILHGFTTL